MNFWYFIKSIGGPEHKIWRCFADITNWDLITPATQANVAYVILLGTLSSSFFINIIGTCKDITIITIIIIIITILN